MNKVKLARKKYTPYVSEDEFKPKRIKGLNWLINIVKKYLFEGIEKEFMEIDYIEIDTKQIAEEIYKFIESERISPNKVDMFLIGRKTMHDIQHELYIKDVVNVYENGENTLYGFKVKIIPYIDGIVPILK